MPDNPVHTMDLECPEFDEVRALVPTSPRPVLPDWEERREQVLADILAEARHEPQRLRPTRRRGWLVGVAAAALVVGGVGIGQVEAGRHRLVVPAAPGVATYPTRPPTATQALFIRVPKGQYWVQRTVDTHVVDTGIAAGRAPTGVLRKQRPATGVVVVDSADRMTRWQDGRKVFSGAAPHDYASDVGKVPGTPAAVRAWLVSQVGVLAGDPEAARTAYEAAQVRWADWATSARYRRLLLAALAQNPGTTTQYLTEQGRRVVRVSFTWRTQGEGGADPAVVVRSTTLDVRTMATLELRKLTTGLDGTVFSDIRTTFTEPGHLTTTPP